MDGGDSGVGGAVGGVERGGDAVVSGIGIAVSNSDGAAATAFRVDRVFGAGSGGGSGGGGVFDGDCDATSVVQGAAAVDAVFSAGAGGVADWDDGISGRAASDGRRIRGHGRGHARAIYLAVSGGAGGTEDCGDAAFLCEWNSGREVW